MNDNNWSIDQYLDLMQLRYQLYGHPRDGVCDCLTLCAEVYRRRGWTFPLPAKYGDGSVPSEAFVDWAKHWTRTTEEPWSIVEMDISGEALHAGVLLPDRNVIHAGRNVGVVLTKLDRLSRIISGYWRLRDREFSGEIQCDD